MTKERMARQIETERHRAARQRLERAQKVLDGFLRRKSEAEQRAVRLRAELAILDESLALAAGQDSEARAEIADAQSALEDAEREARENEGT